MASDTKAIQDIETLKKRHRELDRQKTTAEANFKTAEEQLQRLKEEARAKYGTDDLEELKARLAQMKSDNDRKRSEYQKHLDEIELKLQTIEKQHQG